MPPFPPVGTGAGQAPQIAGGQATYEFLASGGDKAAVQIEITPDVTAAEIVTLRTALGNASNAALYKQSATASLEIPLTRTNPFDESYSDAGMKAVFVFQNDELETRSIALPAPDETLFGPDGVAVLATQPIASAVIAAATVILNGGAAADPQGTFVFVRGYRSDRARSLPRPRTVRQSVEPTGGQLPPPAPGA